LTPDNGLESADSRAQAIIISCPDTPLGRLAVQLCHLAKARIAARWRPLRIDVAAAGRENALVDNK